MLRLKPRQRTVVIGTFPELANLAAVGLIFGQAFTDRPLSWTLLATGAAIWLVLLGATIAIAGADEQW